MSIENEIGQLLQDGFEPLFLEVANESHMHSVPANSETHFRVVIVSDAFAGKRSVARHQAVYGALSELMEGPVHALALHTYTPAEWRERAQTSPQSPECLGGSKADAQSPAQLNGQDSTTEMPR